MQNDIRSEFIFPETPLTKKSEKKYVANAQNFNSATGSTEFRSCKAKDFDMMNPNLEKCFQNFHRSTFNLCRTD